MSLATRAKRFAKCVANGSRRHKSTSAEHMFGYACRHVAACLCNAQL
jgi:hypothetical protein